MTHLLRVFSRSVAISDRFAPVTHMVQGMGIAPGWSRFPPLAPSVPQKFLGTLTCPMGYVQILWLPFGTNPLLAQVRGKSVQSRTPGRLIVGVEATAQSGLMVLPTPLRAHSLNRNVIIQILGPDRRAPYFSVHGRWLLPTCEPPP
jgi:hypothetical protein